MRNTKTYRTSDYDNRDAAQMYEYMEARIEAMRARILHLEAENKTLRWSEPAAHSDSYVSAANSVPS